MSSTRAASPSASNWRLLLLLAVPVALLSGLVSCSSGDPVAPPGQIPGTDTYLLARMTVLDEDFPCVPPNCDAEFFHCRDADPVFQGETFEMRADAVAAGFVAPDNFSISGTDFEHRTGVAFEVQLIRAGAILDGTGQMTNDPNASFADTYVNCNRFADNQPESRFYADPTSPLTSVTITEITLTPDQTAVVRAQPAGSLGAFNPPGIIAGTFSFVALGRQNLTTGPLRPKIRVDGCFRVNVPATEQGVPSTINPASPIAGCP